MSCAVRYVAYYALRYIVSDPGPAAAAAAPPAPAAVVLLCTAPPPLSLDVARVLGPTSRVPDAKGAARRGDGEVRNMGYGRAGAIPQPGAHVLPGGSRRDRCVRRHQ